MAGWSHFAAVYRTAKDHNDEKTLQWLAQHHGTFEGGTRTHLVNKLSGLLSRVPTGEAAAARAFDELPGAALSAIECQSCFQIKYLHEFKAENLDPGLVGDPRRCRHDKATRETIVYKLRCIECGGGFRL